MSISYFVTFSQPQHVLRGDVVCECTRLPVTGIEYAEPNAARHELQELATRINKPLHVRQYVTFDNE